MSYLVSNTQAINAFQCSIVLSQLSGVVRRGEEEELALLIRQLEMHCDVPQA